MVGLSSEPVLYDEERRSSLVVQRRVDIIGGLSGNVREVDDINYCAMTDVTGCDYDGPGTSLYDRSAAADDAT